MHKQGGDVVRSPQRPEGRTVEPLRESLVLLREKPQLSGIAGAASMGCCGVAAAASAKEEPAMTGGSAVTRCGRRGGARGVCENSTEKRTKGGGHTPENTTTREEGWAGSRADTGGRSDCRDRKREHRGPEPELRYHARENRTEISVFASAQIDDAYTS